MDEEQRKRSNQFAGNFGANELLRFGCVFITVQVAGIALGFLLKNFGIALISIALTFGILWLAPYWQPAYTIVHIIMGNQNIPPTLPKYQRKWWNYISITIKVIMLLAILGTGLQLLFK